MRTGKPPTQEERLRWFHQARFGMFIHWGLYALLGRGEWAMYVERIPREEYARLAGRFKPRKFDADAWAGLAAEAGARYMVLTTRHHDGFCLFDSAVSDFTAPKTAARRDFVAEYVTAARRAGLKVGFYYSLLDWRVPGYHDPERHPESAAAMVRQYRDQVRELLTNYGKIDLLWYDGAWLPTVPRGEVAEFWQAKDVNRMARRLQPHLAINNRSGVDEDLDTPEQHVTASQPGRAWESCMTIGDSCGWGYVRHNPNWKTVPQLLQYLVVAARGGGNYLLNVGPKPDGSIRKEEQDRLRAMGRWLKVNGEAIYGAEPTTWLGRNTMLGEWTTKGTVGYLHLFRWPGETAVASGVATRVRRATLLATGKRVAVRQEHNGRLILTGLPKKPPHPAMSTIKVEFERAPRMIAERDPAAWLEGKAR